jgi:hypothetical protein
MLVQRSHNEVSPLIILRANGPIAVFMAATSPPISVERLAEVRRADWRPTLPPRLLVPAGSATFATIEAASACFLRTITSPGLIGFDLSDLRDVLPDGSFGVCVYVSAAKGDRPTSFGPKLISQVEAAGYKPSDAVTALLCIETSGDYALRSIDDTVTAIAAHLGEARFAWVDAFSCLTRWAAALILTFAS